VCVCVTVCVTVCVSVCVTVCVCVSVCDCVCVPSPLKPVIRFTVFTQLCVLTIRDGAS